MFVTFEGPEGAGKSTVISRVADQLRAEGLKVTATREPGGSAIGPDIRHILLHGHELTRLSELFLFLADRTLHVQSLVRPLLEQGEVVLCDRFSDSTIVYQGYARGLDLDHIRMLNNLATGGLKPDLTLLLDLPAEVGLARIQNKDRLDSEPLEFHQRVRDGFLAEAALDPGRFVVIDATLSPENVFSECLAAIRSRL